MRRRISLSILALGLVTSVTDISLKAAPPPIVFVVNANDAGPGSFRAAIDRANASSAVTTIQFIGRVSTIALQQTVWFNGPQNLTINGAGAIVDGRNADGPAFRTTGGGDLTVVKLTVRNAPAEGIAVEVPSSATGTVRVELLDVAIIDNAGHGVLVNDQDDPATPRSRASLLLRLTSLLLARVSSATATAFPIAMAFASTRAVQVISRSRCSSPSPRTMRQTASRSTSVAPGMFASRCSGRESGATASSIRPIWTMDSMSTKPVTAACLAASRSARPTTTTKKASISTRTMPGISRVDMLLVEASRNGEEGIDYEEDDDFAGGGDLVATMELVKTERQPRR